jgi:hypothetical protein
MPSPPERKSMPTVFRTTLPAIVLTLCLCVAAHAAEPPPQVKVKRNKGMLIIDVSMLVPVPQQQAFEVMTDYNHMAGFVSNIKESKITQGNDNKLQVSQSGKAGSGLWSINWSSVREITLNAPNEVQSKIIGGSVKQGESTTRFSRESNQTRIVMHSESSASALLPPIVGVSMVETQIKKQYTEIRDEILKRQKLADSSGSSVPPASSPGK